MEGAAGSGRDVFLDEFEEAALGLQHAVPQWVLHPLPPATIKRTLLSIDDLNRRWPDLEAARTPYLYYYTMYPSPTREGSRNKPKVWSKSTETLFAVRNIASVMGYSAKAAKAAAGPLRMTAGSKFKLLRDAVVAGAPTAAVRRASTAIRGRQLSDKTVQRRSMAAFIGKATALQITPGQLTQLLDQSGVAVLLAAGGLPSASTVYRAAQEEAARLVQAAVHAVVHSDRPFGLEIDDTLNAVAAVHLSAVVLHCPGALPAPFLLRVISHTDHSDGKSTASQLLQVCLEAGLPLARFSSVISDNASVMVKAMEVLQQLGVHLYTQRGLTVEQACENHGIDFMTASKHVQLEAVCLAADLQLELSRVPGSRDAVRAAGAAAAGASQGSEGAPEDFVQGDLSACDLEGIDTLLKLNNVLIVPREHGSFSHALHGTGGYFATGAHALRTLACEQREGLCSLRLLQHERCLSHVLNLANKSVLQFFEMPMKLVSMVSDLSRGNSRTKLVGLLRRAGAWSAKYMFNETRWGSKTAAMEAVLQRRQQLVGALLRESKRPASDKLRLTDPQVTACKALLKMLMTTSIIVEMHVAVSVLRPINELVVACQHHVPATETIQAVKDLPVRLKGVFPDRPATVARVTAAWNTLTKPDGAAVPTLLFLQGDPAVPSDKVTDVAFQHARGGLAISAIASTAVAAVEAAVDKLEKYSPAVSARWALQVALDPRGDPTAGFSAALAASGIMCATEASSAGANSAEQAPPLSTLLHKLHVLSGDQLADPTVADMDGEYALFKEFCRHHTLPASLVRAHPSDLWDQAPFSRFPELRKLVQKAWLVPLSSASVERVFSYATALLRDVRRNRTSASLLNSQLVLMFNKGFHASMTSKFVDQLVAQQQEEAPAAAKMDSGGRGGGSSAPTAAPRALQADAGAGSPASSSRKRARALEPEQEEQQHQAAAVTMAVPEAPPAAAFLVGAPPGSSAAAERGLVGLHPFFAAAGAGHGAPPPAAGAGLGAPSSAAAAVQRGAAPWPQPPALPPPGAGGEDVAWL